MILRIVNRAEKLSFERFDFDADNAQDKFNLWWLPVRALLVLIKKFRFRGKWFKESLGMVIAFGDLVYQGHADSYHDFITEFRAIWRDIEDGADFLLAVLVWIEDRRAKRGRKVSRVQRSQKVISEFVEIGNWIAK